jgi:two-component sensor histidine kinase
MIWQGQVTGVIHVLHDAESRCFTQTDLELVTLFANHAAIAVENARLYERALQDAKTKATLLDEVNHRVKNTLTAIIGLLHVEQSYAEMADQAAYEAIIQNLTNRVSGLATVHDLLSASEWAPLPLSDLAGQVIKSATQMCPRDKQVFIDTPPSPVRVTPDQAHNLALVINELATNTIKHTLPGRNEAHISVRIALEDDGLASHAILFEYRDDGPGYPEDVLRLERHAVGFDLIKNLTRQSLRGELSLHNDEGAVAVIRFPAQA